MKTRYGKSTPLLFTLFCVSLAGCTESPVAQTTETETTLAAGYPEASLIPPSLFAESNLSAANEPHESEVFWPGIVVFGDNHIEYELSDGSFPGKYGT